MSVVLIIGRNGDLCCELVREHLARSGQDVRFLPEDQLFPGLQFVWQAPSATDGRVGYENWETRFGDLRGVFNRSSGVPVKSEDYETKDGQYISAEWHATLMAWLDRLGCPVINRVRPPLWYKTYLNVPDLLALTPVTGFAAPATLLTSRFDEAESFCRRLLGGAIYSPLTQPGRYPIRTEEDIDKLKVLSATFPIHLVEQVAGDGWKAFVAGDSVVPIRPDGEIDDDFPAEVRARCLNLATMLGLSFLQLSLVRTPDDQWYCLGLDRVPHLYECTPPAQQEVTRRVAAGLTRPGGLP